MENEKENFTDEIEKLIPVGIVAATPGEVALVKIDKHVYAFVFLKEGRVRPEPCPYNMAFHGMNYMKDNSIVLSSLEQKSIMNLVEQNKDKIIAECNSYYEEWIDRSY